LEAIGTPMETFSATDYYILGNGFFSLFDPINNEIIFTRNGSFQLNILGQLVNHDGYLVLSRDSNLFDRTFIFINSSELYYDSKLNQNFFLIVQPNGNSVCSISPEYIITRDFDIIDNTDIVSNFLEMMPIDSLTLINFTMQYLMLNKCNNLSNADELIALLRESIFKLNNTLNDGMSTKVKIRFAIIKKLLRRL
jgi:hypothetical protein